MYRKLKKNGAYNSLEVHPYLPEVAYTRFEHLFNLTMFFRFEFYIKIANWTRSKALLRFGSYLTNKFYNIRLVL